MTSLEKIDRSEEEWQGQLSDPQFQVLRKEGTERPWPSPLNDEKRAGTFACAGCGQALLQKGGGPEIQSGRC